MVSIMVYRTPFLTTTNLAKILRLVKFFVSLLKNIYPMKRFPLIFAVCCTILLNNSQSYAWSQKGHDVTAHIAERHLTEATRAAVDSIFEGKSLVYWSNWMDNASHNKPYLYTKTWHYKNIDGTGDYNLSAQHPGGNIITGLTSQIEVLASPSSTKEQKNLALKIVTHLMGDLHQPMHMGKLKDYGGNKVKVKFFDRDTNLHSVWDSNVVETGHKWSYTEWADQLDTPSAQKSESLIIDGDLNDWGIETWEIARKIYETTPTGTKISYNYVADWTPVVEQQFLRGGLRLAHILNSVFDNDYRQSHPSIFGF